MKLRDMILLIFIGLCVIGNMGFSFGSVLYDAAVYGDLEVENDTTLNGSMTVETIKFEVDATNHNMTDNATCIIMTAGTTILNICE